MQNTLEEFFAMVNFTNPGVLGDTAYFCRYYEVPQTYYYASATNFYFECHLHYGSPTHASIAFSYALSFLRISRKNEGNKSFEMVKDLINCIGIPSPPQKSLQDGNWVKFICGASFEDVADIRNLSLVYTLAGDLLFSLFISKQMEKRAYSDAYGPCGNSRKRVFVHALAAPHFQPDDVEVSDQKVILHALAVVGHISEDKACVSTKENGKEVLTDIYDGLNFVEKEERGCYGTLVHNFQLRRISGQPALTIKEADSKNRSKKRKGLCVRDVSNGNEVAPISAINTLDDSKPPSFSYVKEMKYPLWCNLVSSEGCDCVDGCSDSEACSCAMKNGGELPYNPDGGLIYDKMIVYECGPSCQCSQNCRNRVSQNGIKLQLEIFKTDFRGWGVRSLKSIPSGAFICEYIGELLNDEEAERRMPNDEYLFDIGKTDSNNDTYTIDAARIGNIGRFINHSCTGNLYAQDVLFDHGDNRFPHVMLFAQTDIPPLQELTYHYNYELDSVRDSNGNIKQKDCYCGSDECCGRLY